MSVLEAYSISVLAGSTVLFILAVLLNNKKLVLLFSIVILTEMNNPLVTEFFKELLGSGVTIIFLLLITIGTLFIWPVNLSSVPIHLASRKSLLLIITLVLVALSVVASIDPISSVKSFSYLLVIVIIGWVIYGNALKYSQKPRNTMLFIADVFGALCVVNTLAVLIIIGLPMFIDNFRVEGLNQRLETYGANATNIGIANAIALFWLQSAFQRSAGQSIRRLIIKILQALCLISLVWTGSRGPIIAVIGTAIISIYIFKKTGDSKLKTYFRLFLIILFSFYFIKLNYENIMLRGIDAATGNPSVYNLFLSSRVELYGEDIYRFLIPSIFGHGYGAFVSAGGKYVTIESFFLKLWMELGVLGGIVYVLTFLVLTRCVVKVDRYYYAKGELGAFFPSSILIFTWTNSISSWGFSTPVGTLAVQLAIASAATFIWGRLQYQRERTY